MKEQEKKEPVKKVQKRRRTIVREMEPAFNGVAIIGPLTSENWQPTTPIGSRTEAMRYAIHQIRTLGLGEAYPNLKAEDIRCAIITEQNEDKYISYDEKTGEFSMELFLILGFRVGRFTVTKEGFVGRVWQDE